MITFLLVCAGIITVVLTAALIYFIIFLAQLKQTVSSMDVLLKQANEEVGQFRTVTGKIAELVDGLNSPFFKFIGTVVSLAQIIIADLRRRKRNKKDQPKETPEAPPEN
ncbi:MAG: hypothetical protein ABII74_05195 [Elusimicrobiota bacterium]